METRSKPKTKLRDSFTAQHSQLSTIQPLLGALEDYDALLTELLPSVFGNADLQLFDCNLQGFLNTKVRLALVESLSNQVVEHV
jgi:hypothetical protein